MPPMLPGIKETVKQDGKFVNRFRGESAVICSNLSEI